uniref:Uncharacterized protein n=1 Tax=Eptatretus burgeri TaxID=7764 RepID=A0A8C4NIQ2_EPTBU
MDGHKPSYKGFNCAINNHFIFSILQAAKAKKGYNAVNNAITKQPTKESQKDKKASLPSTDLELIIQPPDSSRRREGQSMVCLAECLLRLPGAVGRVQEWGKEQGEGARWGELIWCRAGAKSGGCKTGLKLGEVQGWDETDECATKGKSRWGGVEEKLRRGEGGG